MNITLQFDGGCNPNPGQMYGSYALLIDGTEVFSKTEDYGHGTNNVAEFKALYEGLLRTIDFVFPLVYLNKVDLLVITDSTIVRNRLMGTYRNSKKYRGSDGAKRMDEWTSKVKPLLEMFKSFEVQWSPRQVNVDRFGH